MAKHIFTEAEKDQIKQAVKELEIVSCGEIVPYFVKSSDDYPEASWYLSTAIGAFVSMIIGVLSYSWMLPFRLTPMDISIFILGSMVVGFFIPVIIPASKRLIIARERQAERVHQRAVEAFLSEKVYKTEEKVGILIFISELEHLVLVMGDEGINARVAQKDWEDVVTEIVSGIRSGQVAQGLVSAIALCKELLLKNGFVRKSTDTNELGDGLRMGD